MDSLTIIFILNGVFFISFFLLKNIYIPLGLSLITLFILLFVFKKKDIPSFHAGFNMPRFTINNNQYIVTIACLIIFVILEKFIGFNAAVFAAFFIFVRLNKLDSRVSFFITLILLVITAFLAASGNIKVAEDISVLVYYLLIIGVVWQIIELRKENPDDKEEEMIPEQKKEKVKVISNTFMRQYKSTYNFFTIKNIIIAGFFIFLCLGVALYFLYSKFQVRKNTTITPINAPIVTPTPTPLRHVPFTILNATSIHGFAGSSATALRSAGWDDEFDITVGNYTGTASANILRYTKTLEKKIKLLESALNIQITPIIMKDATREAEMTLILGK